MGLAERAANAAEEQQATAIRKATEARQHEIDRQRKFLHGAFGVEPVYVGEEDVDELVSKVTDSFTRRSVRVVQRKKHHVWLVDDVRVARAWQGSSTKIRLILQDVQHGQYFAGEVRYYPFEGDGYTGKKTPRTKEERLEHAAASIGALLGKKHPVFEASGRICECCGQVIQ